MNIRKLSPLAISSILIGFCWLVPFFLNQPAYAASASCAEIDNAAARLQCYDERDRRDANPTPEDSAPVFTSQPVLRNPTSVAEPEPTTESDPAAETGPEPQVIERIVERIVYVDLPDAQAPEELRSTILTITEPLSGRGRKVYLLENGERWQEARDYGLRLQIGSNVHLKKGALTGYNMTSGRNTIRVAKLN